MSFLGKGKALIDVKNTKLNAGDWMCIFPEAKR